MIKDTPIVDLTKPLQTRDGHSVRILCTDRVVEYGDKRTIVALVTAVKHQHLVEYHPDGTYLGSPKHEHPWDLVNVQEKVEGYMHIYYNKDEDKFSGGYLYKTLAEAKRNMPAVEVATIKVEFYK